MFTRYTITYSVEPWLLTFLLYGLIGGCSPTLTEPVGSLKPGHEIITLNTRPGVTTRVLVSTPKTAPKGTVIVFMGGSALLVGEGGRVRAGFDGQHGTELFAEHGFAAVVVDVPSDQPWPASDHFRVGKAHAEDFRKVIEFVSQKWSKPIVLMGHSRGTISVAHLAATVKDDRIRGVVLAGSKVRQGRDSRLGGGPGLALADLRLENIRYPTLFVHHRDDGCMDIQAVREQRKRVMNSPKVVFVEVIGGNSPPGHDPCSGGTNPHTFMGKQREVITTIAGWVSGKAVAEIAA